MSDPASANPAADRNLLFGILAVQMDFVGRDQLIAAMHSWVLAKHRPLGELLQEQGALTAENRQLLEQLVTAHLGAHGGDVRRSLAAAAHPSTLSGAAVTLSDSDFDALLAAFADGPATTAEVHRPLPAEGMRYEVLRPHARGGLGLLSVARDAELGREVALKEMLDQVADDPASRDRFVREAEVTGGLEHPGIVPVYGLGRYADGRPYYAMRFVRGETLEDAIKKLHAGEEGYTLRGLLTRFVAVCNAVAYAHSRGVIHRDIKPANIMLGSFGETLVVDWGLAKVVGRSTGSKGDMPAEGTLQVTGGDGRATRAGSLLGTPQFMSPEQARGEVDTLTPATDVYSLGATLYCLLTGGPPVRGADAVEILEKVWRGEWSAPRHVKSSVPRALDAVCRKAMALRPEGRCGSALELADDVERWLADEPVRAWREPWTVRAARWRRRHRALVVGTAAAALVALLLGGAGLAWWQQERARRWAGAEGYLTQVDDLQARERWAEARVALEQADDRLGGGGPADLRRRLEEARSNLELVARLDGIRQKAITQFSGPTSFDTAAPDRDYEAAFGEAGLGVPGTDPEVTARLVADSPVRNAVVAALDHWAQVAAGPRRAWALGVARRAAPDPWLDRLRDPAAWEDEATLSQLARTASAEKVTPALAGALGGRLRRAGEGENLLRAAQALRPGDFYLNFNLASVLAANGRAAQAEGFYRAAISLRPDTSPAYFNLGRLLVQQGRMAEAEPLLEKAFENYTKPLGMKPEVARAWAVDNFGDLYESYGKLDEAAAICRKAIEVEAGNAIAHRALGWVLQRRGKFDEAADRYREAIELDPRNARSLAALGWVLHRQGKPGEAEPLIRKAIALDPGNAVFRNDLGVVLQNLGKLDEAAAALRRAAELDPTFVWPWSNLGTVLERKGKLDEATDCYRKAVALNPLLVETLDNLGQALQRQGKTGEAAAVYQKAVDAFPEGSAALPPIGWALERCGKLTEAEAAFRKGARYPGNAEALDGLGWVLHRQGKSGEAEPLIRKAIALSPRNANFRNDLGRMLQNQGKLDEAAESFRKAAELAPGAVWALANLGNVLDSQGKLDDEAAVIAKIIELEPSQAWPPNNLGWIRERQNKQEEAATLYRKAAELSPKWDLPNIHLSRVLLKLGQYPRAAESARHTLELLPRASPRRAEVESYLRKATMGERLPDILRGAVRLTDASEGYVAANLCYDRQLYADAARLASAALAEDPKLADYLRSFYRYNAACSAALAGCGKGQAAPDSSEEQRRWRRQALDWLRADLALHSKTLTAGPPEKAWAAAQLKHWLADKDFAGVRDAAEMAKLPETERREWEAFWAEVKAAQAGPTAK